MDTVTCTIDGIEIVVPKNTLIIRAAELLGIQVPRFCDHPLLEPLGACRQCIVEVEGQRKPLTACTTTVTDGMVIKTQLTSEVAEKAQRGTIEFLLLNHPLDCPVCDKGGECPLQNQAMSNGPAESRFRDVKRTFQKPIPISSQVLLDRERCVLCARCTRFSQQIAGDPFIELFERGALEQVAIYEDEPFESYFSGNTVQICPVGALTGVQYRFRARPFDLVSTPSVCEHCASGCAQRADWRRGVVMRRLAGDDKDVNAEWNCDKGRWAFQYATQPDRLTQPLVRDNGELREASWTEALERAADGLRDADGSAAVLTGGRLTAEDAYAYSKFARVVLNTNDIDFRARPHTVEEQEFLATQVAGTGIGVTYADIDHAPAVLLVGFEPEEESPIVFLRLRKASRHGTQVFAVAPFTTSSIAKTNGRLIRTAPGGEPSTLGELQSGDVGDALRKSGALILAGERLGFIEGGLSAAASLAQATGARLAWIPRRAGDRGAVEMGCLPNLLPGGHPLTNTDARTTVARHWNAADLPTEAGRDVGGILADARVGACRVLVVAGVDPGDLPDPAHAQAALDAVPFLISLEIRRSDVTERADVVFPVAPPAEKSGTYVDWEGRPRPYDVVLQKTGALPDLRVLHMLAHTMGQDLGLPSVDAARTEIGRLAAWTGDRPGVAATAARSAPQRQAGQAVLATWHQLLDAGRMQDGEPHLAATAREPRALLSENTAREVGVKDGDPLSVVNSDRRITLPLRIADLPDGVVWVPTNAAGSHVRRDLGALAGDVVGLEPGGRP